MCLDCGALLTLCLLREPGVRLEAPESLPIRLIDAVSMMVGWFEFWWIAVLIAEFAIACQASRLVERMEYLGYAILVGAACSVGLIGWTIPHPTLFRDADDGAGLLAGLASFIVLGVLLWSLEASASAATLARLLSDRCVQVQEKSQDGSETP